MSFSGNVIKEKSYDPNYKVEFSYEDGDIKIELGIADIIRKQPRLVIDYDELTSAKLKAADKTKLELELTNLVLNYFIAGASAKSLKFRLGPF
jgi:hypothetical protein